MNESKESKEKWETWFLIFCTIVTVIACILAIWITVQNAKYAAEIKDLKSEIVQAVVVDYDLDNMLLFVTNDIDDEQVVVEVEVLLKETEASVTVAAERNILIGRQVAYLSWQNKKVLLTIFTPYEEEQNANTVVY